MLILDRRGVRIPFEVRSASGDGMHVRFDLSGGNAGAFRAAFEDIFGATAIEAAD